MVKNRQCQKQTCIGDMKKSDMKNLYNAIIAIIQIAKKPNLTFSYHNDPFFP